MKYDYTYNSEERNCELSVSINYEVENPVSVLFEKEGLVLSADRDGNAVITDSEGAEVFRGKAENSKKYFSEVRVSAKDGSIIVNYPVKETIDHYPNCDGEYDRYSEVIVDNVIITYLLNA